MSARRLRGISFLASLFVTLLVSLLTALSVLDWWSVPLVLAILIADVAWLRQVAMSERADRAHAQASPAGAAARSAPGRSDAVFDSRHEVQPRPEAQPELEAEPEHQAEPEPELETVFGTEAVFEQPEAGSLKVTLPIELPGELDPSGWEPVPVPPPTYTLKAKAEPVTRPNAVTNHEAGQPWSLEGMVYDCELDELVERRSATGA